MDLKLHPALHHANVNLGGVGHLVVIQVQVGHDLQVVLDVVLVVEAGVTVARAGVDLQVLVPVVVLSV